jgi:hypothetical protein
VNKHILNLIGAALLLVAAMFYPFFPGDYDGLAVTLSIMSQLVGIAGVLLVPLGAIWLAYEFRRVAKEGGVTKGKGMGYWFGFVSIWASIFVALVVAVGAIVDAHLSFGLAFLILWACYSSRLFAKLRERQNAEVRTLNPAPLYLVFLPVVALVFKFTLIGSASEFSRNRAMDNSATLISDIERYRDAHGNYPQSLQSLWDDYRPSVVCIKRYHYEPNGEAFNLYFENLSANLGVREIVLYNKREEHEFTSHNADLLQFTGTGLALRRGHISSRDASRPNWKYFSFD